MKRKEKQIPLTNFVTKMSRHNNYNALSSTNPSQSCSHTSANLTEGGDDVGSHDALHNQTHSDTYLEQKSHLSIPHSISQQGKNAEGEEAPYDSELNKDISEFLDKNLSDLQREYFLRHAWIPTKDFKFPIKTDDKRHLKFQRAWLDLFNWLIYSKKEDSAYCKYCVLFASQSKGKGNHQHLGYLVRKGLRNWKKAKDIFIHHASLTYHIEAIKMAENFLSIYDGKQRNIKEVINSEFSKRSQENRAKLVSIIKTIILCGRQEIPLRGTSDYGNVLDEKHVNDGTFRALLRFRVDAGDEILELHLKNGSKNAQYTSASVQNQIINICGDIVKKSIVEKVNQSSVFSVLIDETTDISRTEQMSFCLRYIDPIKKVLREDFLEFVSISDLTGEGIASCIINRLETNGIDTTGFIGQGYDGAAAMSGSYSGAQAVIKRKFPLALFVHCSAHSLNLAIADTCKIRNLSNCLGTINSVGNFFHASALRSNILSESIKSILPDSRHKSLIAMCETRWVQRHDSVLRFDEIILPVAHALEKIKHSGNRDTSQAANQLLVAIQSDDFLINMNIANKLFSITINLCKYLQSAGCDLATACDHVDNVIIALSEIREQAEANYSLLFKRTEEQAKKLNGDEFTIAMPRRVGRQQHRSNVAAENPEEYYRRTSFIPVIDHIINHLRERFTNHKSVLRSLSLLMPQKFTASTYDDLKSTVEFYSPLLHDVISFEGEFIVWRAKLSKIDSTQWPTTPLEALDNCNIVMFPIIHKLLSILVTLPVSTATPERTFSSLRRMKTFLRNSMGQSRLTGLALMSIHRDVDINPEIVATHFISDEQSSRRLSFK